MTYTEYSNLISEPQASWQATVGRFKCTFVFPTFIQTMYDNVLADVENRRLADPLTDAAKQSIHRQYDWLDYYLNIEEPGEIRPQSLWGKTESQLEDILRERKTLATSISALLLDYKEMLKWHCQVEDTEGEIATFVCDIEKGSWFNDCIAFVFPDDTLSYSRVPTLAVIVKTADDE